MVEKTSTELFEDEENLRLAKKMAHKFMRMGKKRIEFDDLHQEALIALHDAAERFDVTRGIPFPNFAIQVMHLSMVSYMYKQNDFYTPMNIIATAAKIAKQKLKDFSVEEIADKLKVPLNVATLAVKHLNQSTILDLHAPIQASAGNREIELIDTLADTENLYDPTLLDFKNFVSGLDMSKQTILIDIERGFDMVEIATKLGVTPPTVRNYRIKLHKKFNEYMK